MLQLLFLINTASSQPDFTEKWQKTPDIRICWSSNVQPETVRKALTYITDDYNTGVDVSKIRITTNNFCGVPRSLERGYIYIDKYEIFSDVLAVTKTNATLYEEEWIMPTLNYAYIQFPDALLPYKDGAFILAHEIGHALGMSHDDNDHLMKTYY